jgi:hypothetical protein
MIDFNIINNSIIFYGDKGFERIEAPWTVSEFTSGITKSKDQIDYEVHYNNKKKVLVASGEQSFLYLYLKGFLPKGRLMTVTPCFRYETFDFLHTKYFLKNELIDTKNVNERSLNEIVDTCYTFFKGYISDLDIVKTNEGYDICYKDMEIGSYGIRSCEFLEWIYATGVAEPRFSSIINMIKIKETNGIS